jgi:pyruvate/2-oxoglutarate dehydrogenase complex dihydrolipoamide acyltransferase (E2) component
VFELRLPQWGMGLDEGTIVSWAVQPGDRVAIGDVLGVVDTAKVEADLEAPVAGRLVEICVDPGATVPVGTLLVRIDLEG